MIKIIDVSKHQGNVDFNAVATTDIKAVIIRAGFGLSTVDEKFYHNISGCEKANLPVGIYWFSYATNADEARKEAAKCIETIRNYHISLPIFFDWEYDSERYAKQQGVYPTRRLITDMIKEFCMTIEAAGYEAGYYFNEDYRKNKIYENELPYHTWYARYNESIAAPNYDIWQYTSIGSVNGVVGNVDVSYLLNETLLSKPTTPNTPSPSTPEPTPEPEPIPEPEPTPEPIPVKKTNDQIADEVIAGKWGNGIARMRKLKAAGYSYVKIQTLVNKKLRKKK